MRRRRSAGWQAAARAALVPLVLLWAPPSFGQVRDASPAELKAAYLVNFLRYTEWPANSFPDSETPIRVVVIGDDDVADALLEIAARSAAIGGRPIEVRSPRLPGRRLRESDAVLEELRTAHAIYVAEPDDDRAVALLEAVGGYDVLTVGGSPTFATLGGMIGLREEGRRIAFDANPHAIRQTRLRVSARVLQLARVVETGGS
jgi:hypothetical protein